MGVSGATTILKRECEFLGLSMNNLFTMIRRNPGAFSAKTIEAFKIYTRID
jgi:hypothetical protein